MINYNFNIVFFIPAIKINFYIRFFKKYFFKRKIFIAKEMTKLHETFYRENVEDIEEFKNKLKGELTIVLSKPDNVQYPKEVNFDKRRLIKEAKKYLKRYSLKDVVKLIVEKNNLSKKKVYDLCLKAKNE